MSQAPKGRFILVEVVERDISVPEFFDTWEDAEHEMLKRLKQVMDLDDNDLAQAIPADNMSDTKIIDNDVYFSGEMACCERHGQNYDWKIFDTDAKTN